MTHAALQTISFIEHNYDTLTNNELRFSIARLGFILESFPHDGQVAAATQMAVPILEAASRYRLFLRENLLVNNQRAYGRQVQNVICRVADHRMTFYTYVHQQEQPLQIELRVPDSVPNGMWNNLDDLPFDVRAIIAYQLADQLGNLYIEAALSGGWVHVVSDSWFQDRTTSLMYLSQRLGMVAPMRPVSDPAILAGRIQNGLEETPDVTAGQLRALEAWGVENPVPQELFAFLIWTKLLSDHEGHGDIAAAALQCLIKVWSSLSPQARPHAVNYLEKHIKSVPSEYSGPLNQFLYVLRNLGGYETNRLANSELAQSRELMPPFSDYEAALKWVWDQTTDPTGAYFQTLAGLALFDPGSGWTYAPMDDGADEMDVYWAIQDRARSVNFRGPATVQLIVNGDQQWMVLHPASARDFSGFEPPAQLAGSNGQNNLSAFAAGIYRVYRPAGARPAAEETGLFSSKLRSIDAAQLSAEESAMLNRVVDIFDDGIFSRGVEGGAGQSLRSRIRLYESLGDASTVHILNSGDNPIPLFFINRDFIQTLIRLEKDLGAHNSIANLPSNLQQLGSTDIVQSIIYGIGFHEIGGHLWNGSTRSNRPVRFGNTSDWGELSVQAFRGGKSNGLNTAAYRFYLNYRGQSTRLLDKGIALLPRRVQREIRRWEAEFLSSGLIDIALAIQPLSLVHIINQTWTRFLSRWGIKSTSESTAPAIAGSEGGLVIFSPTSTLRFQKNLRDVITNANQQSAIAVSTEGHLSILQMEDTKLVERARITDFHFGTVVADDQQNRFAATYYYDDPYAPRYGIVVYQRVNDVPVRIQNLYGYSNPTLSGDGHTLAYHRDSDHVAVCRWTGQSFTEFQVLEMKHVGTILLSEDGSSLAIASHLDRSSLDVYHLAETHYERQWRDGYPGYVDILMSPNGHLLAVGSYTAKVVSIFDNRNGNRIAQLNLGDHYPVQKSMTISDDGTVMTAAGRNVSIFSKDPTGEYGLPKIFTTDDNIRTFAMSNNQAVLMTSGWEYVTIQPVAGLHHQTTTALASRAKQERLWRVLDRLMDMDVTPEQLNAALEDMSDQEIAAIFTRTHDGITTTATDEIERKRNLTIKIVPNPDGAGYRLDSFYYTFMRMLQRDWVTPRAVKVDTTIYPALTKLYNAAQAVPIVSASLTVRKSVPIVNYSAEFDPAWIGNSSISEIQERSGQLQLSQSSVLPALGTGDNEALAWRQLGFTLGPLVEGDPWFRHVKFPAGWQIVPVPFEHPTRGGDYRNSDVVDADGNVVAIIFYEATWYKRTATVRFISKQENTQLNGDAQDRRLRLQNDQRLIGGSEGLEATSLGNLPWYLRILQPGSFITSLLTAFNVDVARLVRFLAERASGLTTSSHPRNLSDRLLISG